MQTAASQRSHQTKLILGIQYMWEKAFVVSHKQLQEVFNTKAVSENFAIFPRNRLCWSRFLKRDSTPVFSYANIVKFLRAPILKNIGQRLLLNVAIKLSLYWEFTIRGKTLSLFHRSSHRRLLNTKVVFKNFAILRRNHLCWSLFLKRDSSKGVFLLEYFEIFKNTYFEKHIRTAACQRSHQTKLTLEI